MPEEINLSENAGRNFTRISDIQYHNGVLLLVIEEMWEGSDPEYKLAICELDD